MAIFDHVYDNWGNVTPIDRFYEDLPVVYKITTSAGSFEIEEPVGWDKITFVHKRNKDYHGFNYEMVGDDIDLRFESYSGFTEVYDEYALNGNDGDVLFERILMYVSVQIIEYQGRLNLNTLKRTEDGFNCSIERKSLQQQISARLNNKVNLRSEIDLDENPVVNGISKFLALSGQVLSETFRASQTIKKEEAFTETRTGDESVILLFNINEPLKNTTPGFIGSTLGISGDSGALTNDTHNIFDFPANGSYHISLELDFQVELRISPRIIGINKKVTSAYITTRLERLRGTGSSLTRTTIVIDQTAVIHPNVQGFQYPRVQATYEGDIEILTGDRLMLYAYIRYDHNANKLKSISIKVQEYKTIFEMDGSSDAAPSIHQGWLIKDCIERTIKRITGASDILRTDFYSPEDASHLINGCGSQRMLTTGAHLRGSSIANLPITTTFKDLLEAINSWDCIGMGYEWDPAAKKELIRIEPTEYFYKDVLVLNVGVIADPSEETARDLIFNKINVGYDKFKEEDDNSLDEMHAYHEYSTPIRTESNLYDIRSKYIASGYIVEVTRRLMFEEDTNASTTYDDDIFVIHVVKPGEGTLELYGPVTYHPFAEVTGMVSPTTTINLSLTPKRMLMAHSKWLMSSLVYKSASQIIQNTFTKQNKTASTTLAGGYCQRGDILQLPLRADADIPLGAFGDFTGIYSPEWVTFKSRLTMAEVRYIMNCHRGLSPDNNNYGYIQYTDELNQVRKGWLFELTYNKENQEATIKLLKKKFPS